MVLVNPSRMINVALLVAPTLGDRVTFASVPTTAQILRSNQPNALSPAGYEHSLARDDRNALGSNGRASLAVVARLDMPPRQRDRSFRTADQPSTGSGAHDYDGRGEHCTRAEGPRTGCLRPDRSELHG